MIRAEAETCFATLTKYENKYFDATLAFDDWKFRAHKGPNNPKHNIPVVNLVMCRIYIPDHHVQYITKYNQKRE